MTYKVYLTFNVGPTEKEEKALGAVGAELIQPDGESEEDLIRICGNPETVALLIGPNAHVTKKVIDSIPNLKILSRLGVGYNNIDVAAATARGIPVSLVLDYCMSEVADHAMALILMMARKIVPISNLVKNGGWADVPSLRKQIFRLSETTLGIFGLGKIGRALAARAKAFGMGIIACDPYLTAAAAKQHGVEIVGFERLLAESDFLSAHSPLIAETAHIFKLDAFRKMKRTAYFINNARGGVVDEKGLYTALKQGYIAGAGIDVVDPEPPGADNPLFKLDNIFITGHTSFYSEQSVAELRRKSVEAIVDVLQGRRPTTLANPEIKS
jgi:D-3-phosphoglycerate dehydrogenase / 2-oxoglutarate reductase